jgi:hypothetical protein
MMRRSDSFESCNSAGDIRDADAQSDTLDVSGLVSDDEDTTPMEESGMLIVASQMIDEEDGYDILGTSGGGQQTPMSLSIPESVPSNVDSISITLDPLQQRPSQRASGSESSSMISCVPEEGEEGAKKVEGKFAVPLSIVLALFCFLFLSLSPAFYLLWERNQLNSATLRLQEEVRLLSQEVKNSNKEKGRPLDPPPDQFSWEQRSSSCPSPSPSEHTRIDNCWVRAEANFELGECGVKTTKKVKKEFHKMKKKFWNFQEEFMTKVHQYAESAPPLFQTWGSQNDDYAKRSNNAKNKMKKNFWNAQEEFMAKFHQYAESASPFFQTGGSQNIDDANRSNHAKNKMKRSSGSQKKNDAKRSNHAKNTDEGAAVKVKDQMQNIGKVATDVLTGVAFASAAALLISGAFILGDNDN